MKVRGSHALGIGGFAMLFITLLGGLWLYPEFRRYMHIRKM